MESLMAYLSAWGLNDGEPWTFLSIVLMRSAVCNMRRLRRWPPWSCRKL